MLQAVHGWSSTYERLVKSQKFFSSYLTQEDLSRFGRNAIETGFFIQQVFPEKGIRFIAINDRFDTVDGITDLTFDKGTGIRIPITNILNEEFSVDIRRKQKASIDTQIH